jgi:LDH2 family malate/lactate/ureidoglycolate dehydrogenase
MITSPTGIRRLENLMVKMLRGVGMRPSDARAVAWVYAAMTLRGVGHHDVGGFPGLLRRLEDGTHNPRPRIQRPYRPPKGVTLYAHLPRLGLVSL